MRTIRRRRSMQWLLAAMASPSPSLATAEPKVIGILNPFSAADSRPGLDVFDAEMRKLGYQKGVHYVVVERMADGRNDRLVGMANELARLNVDLILASTTNAVAEAARATPSIPIVFVSVSDPVGSGFAVNLSRPGRNLTGVVNTIGDLAGKRLQFLKELVPGLERITALVTPKTPTYPAAMPRLRSSAAALGLTTSIVEAQLPLDFRVVARDLQSGRAQALHVFADPYLWDARDALAAMALQARLPTDFVFAEHVEAGGLLSYGADTNDWMRQSAVLVDKIFKGARPADLPIEQPSKFDLVINRTTANRLGLKIPQALLLQARIIG